MLQRGNVSAGRVITVMSAPKLSHLHDGQQIADFSATASASRPAHRRSCSHWGAYVSRSNAQAVPESFTTAASLRTVVPKRLPSARVSSACGVLHRTHSGLMRTPTSSAALAAGGGRNCQLCRKLNDMVSDTATGAHPLHRCDRRRKKQCTSPSGDSPLRAVLQTTRPLTASCHRCGRHVWYKS